MFNIKNSPFLEENAQRLNYEGQFIDTVLRHNFCTFWESNELCGRHAELQAIS
jgi:hypothetical protein